jgi:hypothetical protein
MLLSVAEFLDTRVDENGFIDSSKMSMDAALTGFCEASGRDSTQSLH